MGLDQAINDIKTDLNFIEAISLYNVKTQECRFTDNRTYGCKLSSHLCRTELSENSKFIYLEVENESFFAHYNMESLLIAKMKNDIEINQVILQLKIDKFHRYVIMNNN